MHGGSTHAIATQLAVLNEHLAVIVDLKRETAEATKRAEHRHEEAIQLARREQERAEQTLQFQKTMKDAIQTQNRMAAASLRDAGIAIPDPPPGEERPTVELLRIALPSRAECMVMPVEAT